MSQVSGLPSSREVGLEGGADSEIRLQEHWRPSLCFWNNRKANAGMCSQENLQATARGQDILENLGPTGVRTARCQASPRFQNRGAHSVSRLSPAEPPPTLSDSQEQPASPAALFQLRSRGPGAVAGPRGVGAGGRSAPRVHLHAAAALLLRRGTWFSSNPAEAVPPGFVAQATPGGGPASRSSVLWSHGSARFSAAPQGASADKPRQGAQGARDRWQPLESWVAVASCPDRSCTW